MPAIEIKGLRKTYKTPFFGKGFEALKNVNISVKSGSIFGLIGPNGAGKTTTVKSILNLVNPTSGAILIFGQDSRNKRARCEIGYMPETEKYPSYLTGLQFLEVFLRLSRKSVRSYDTRLEKLLDKLDISNAIDKKISTYSRGMKKKLGFIQAVLHEPKLLLLDEPIEGLDPVGKKRVLDILMDYRKDGKTVLINSHYLSEVEKICDRAAIIKQGKILMELDIEKVQKKIRGYIS